MKTKIADKIKILALEKKVESLEEQIESLTIQVKKILRRFNPGLADKPYRQNMTKNRPYDLHTVYNNKKKISY